MKYLDLIFFDGRGHQKKRVDERDGRGMWSLLMFNLLQTAFIISLVHYSSYQTDSALKFGAHCLFAAVVPPIILLGKSHLFASTCFWTVSHLALAKWAWVEWGRPTHIVTAGAVEMFARAGDAVTSANLHHDQKSKDQKALI
ncbi:hypothetical protein VNO77_24141 [Canavalia gladiata]|uniref:Uncharacterized protein n=1 Tax=Canavalia gladiata TaxID=3824 RepID=A0AAN9QFY4_CANGL